MKIDAKIIKNLEDLSNFSLSDDEKSRIETDLQKVMDDISKLNDLNTDGAPECTQPFDIVNIYRDDEVQASFDRELILKNAPERNDEMFIAPKTME